MTSPEPAQDDAPPPDPSQPHLSQIPTLWSVVRASTSGAPDAAAAQRQLLNQYGGSVRRYLQACLRDADAVDEVYQEFALRLVRGDFHSASQTRGRFRNYVKTVVYRLMVDHHRTAAKLRHQVPLPQEPAAESAEEALSASDATFTQSWREELLAQAWAALEQDERRGGPPYHTALQLRVEHPEWASTDLARHLGQRLGRELQSGAVRIMIHRARERFADAIISAVAHSLDQASFETVEEELLDLNLMSYCRSALQRYRSQP